MYPKENALYLPGSPPESLQQVDQHAQLIQEDRGSIVGPLTPGVILGKSLLTPEPASFIGK